MTRLGHATRSRHATTSYSTGGGLSRNHRVKPRSVVCPDCGAEIGAPCVNDRNETYGSTGTTHRSRQRMATRAMNALIGSDWDLLKQLRTVTFKERRALRQRSGLAYSELGHIFGVNPRTVRAWFSECDPGPDHAVAFARWLLEVRAS